MTSFIDKMVLSCSIRITCMISLFLKENYRHGLILQVFAWTFANIISSGKLASKLLKLDEM